MKTSLSGLLQNTRRFFAPLSGVAFGVLYGIVCRLVFEQAGTFRDVYATLGISFLLFSPLVLGFVTGLAATREQRSGRLFWLSAPLLALLVAEVFSVVIALEYAFCILIATPAFMVEAVIGGLVGAAIAHQRDKRNQPQSMLGVVIFALLLPYLAAPVEARFPVRSEVRQVHSSLVIAASPETVWANITTLQPIGPGERREAVFHLLGLPRPLEARMACEQVGCIRRGEWEDGLAFDGRITRLEPGVSYWVELTADAAGHTSRTAPLEAIGGPLFDMVDDGYVIEDLGHGQVRLHLYSSYRLSTRINPYAAAWLDFLLADIQGYILGVEKARSEAGG
ncbi:MAG: hypothetical protein HYZ26_00755 [Chloroflexi bacterium]|nr:hypothetical protein [Chloroflexota bacterium]